MHPYLMRLHVLNYVNQLERQGYLGADEVVLRDRKAQVVGRAWLERREGVCLAEPDLATVRSGSGSASGSLDLMNCMGCSWMRLRSQ